MGSSINFGFPSPSGRIQWVSRKSGSLASGLRANNTDYSPTFKGSASNGDCQLRVQDSVRGNRARLNQFSITVTGLAE